MLMFIYTAAQELVRMFLKEHFHAHLHLCDHKFSKTAIFSAE